MSNEKAPETNPWTIAVVLAVALGPLTTLALGSKYADEETRERARAGLVTAAPCGSVDRFGPRLDELSSEHGLDAIGRSRSAE